MAENRLNLLLLGKTGHGKSATGNSILGRKVFKTSASSDSVTREVACGYTEFAERIIKVVDGPYSNFCDRIMESDTELPLHMSEALSRCNGGYHAIVFVQRFGKRFTDDDFSSLVSLRKMLRSNFFSHMIVVVTGGDNFQDDMEDEGRNISFLDWCREQRGAFSRLFNKCEGRFVLFNNRERDEMKMLEQRKHLINIADGLSKRNGRYVSENFTFGKKLPDITIRVSATPLAIRQRLSLLSTKIEHLGKDPLDIARKQITKCMQDFKEEIETEDREDNQTNDLQEFPSIMELSHELENIRETKTMFSLMGSGFTIAGGALGLLVPFVGAVAAVTGAVSTIVGRMQIESKEKEIQNTQKEIMEQLLKENILFTENKEGEFKRKTKYD